MSMLSHGQKVFLAFVLLFLSAFFPAHLSVAATTQQEVVSVMAYFPTPDGVFRILRLMSSSGCVDATACSNLGEICWSSGLNNYLVCSEYEPGDNRWQIPDIWEASDETNPPTLFYGEPNAVNNVGIGTNTPNSTLDLRGTSNTCVSIPYTNSSGDTLCPSGFVTMTGRTSGGAHGAFGTSYFLCCQFNKDHRNMVSDSSVIG
jgi:hypothetical protein